MPKNKVSDVDGLHRLNPDREQVLARLWEIAHLSPEMTRNSVTGQVKALSMIIAMQNFIPDPRALSSEKKSTTAPSPPQPSPAPPVPACRGNRQEDPPTRQGVPYLPLFGSVPDLGVAFPIKKEPP